MSIRKEGNISFILLPLLLSSLAASVYGKEKLNSTFAP
jgi:hypothetical protein